MGGRVKESNYRGRTAPNVWEVRVRVSVMRHNWHPQTLYYGEKSARRIKHTSNKKVGNLLHSTVGDCVGAWRLEYGYFLEMCKDKSILR